MIRLPQSGLDEALQAIEALALPACPQQAQPFLEVRLLLPKPEARIRERVLAAIGDKPVRLARITTSYQGSGQGLADGAGQRRLDELSPQKCSAFAISVSLTESRRPSWWRRLKRSWSR